MKILQDKQDSPVTDNNNVQVYGQRIITMTQEQRIRSLEERVKVLEEKLNQIIGNSENTLR